jgi:hypothetical protein
MITLRDIETQMSEYLLGRIEGNRLVDLINDAVSGDDVYEYELSVQNLILELQDILALYVEDVDKRTDHTSYFGPDHLKSVVLKFQCKLRSRLQ